MTVLRAGHTVDDQKRVEAKGRDNEMNTIPTFIKRMAVLVVQSVAVSIRSRPTNQCTRIAITRLDNGYLPANKRVIVATIAGPQSGDFKRYA